MRNNFVLFMTAILLLQKYCLHKVLNNVKSAVNWTHDNNHNLYKHVLL